MEDQGISDQSMTTSLLTRIFIIIYWIEGKVDIDYSTQ